jgi:hypothetical protein
MNSETRALLVTIFAVVLLSLLCIAVALYEQSICLQTTVANQVFIGVLISVGTTLLTAIILGLSIEWYTATKLEKLFKKWEGKAARAALAALADTDLPDDIVDSMRNALRDIDYVQRNYSRTFRFLLTTEGYLSCKVTTHVELHNIKASAISSPHPYGFLRAFLPDLGRNMIEDDFKLIAPNGGVLFHETKTRPKINGERLYFDRSIDIPKGDYRTLESTVSFLIPEDNFSTFLTFSTPVKGIRVSIETDMPNSSIGIECCSPRSFDGFREECRSEKSLTVSYCGAAFAGQAFALWIYRKGDDGPPSIESTMH